MTKHETLIQAYIGKEIYIIVGDRAVEGTVEGMVGDSVAFKMKGQPFVGGTRLLLAASNVVVLSD